MSNKILIVGAFACLSAMAMAQSGASTGNAAGQGQHANTQDAAAGLPAGKRMHKPVAVEQVSSKGTQNGGSADRESSQPSVSEVVVTKPAATAQDSSKGTPSGGSADRESSQPSVSEIAVTKQATESKPAAKGDINNDGKIDIVVINSGEPPALLLNETPTKNHRVLFRLVGTKSNKSAIGARVTVKAGKLAQVSEVRAGGSYLSQNDPRLHFGLGGENKIDEVEIRWPSGKLEILREVPADFIYSIVEGQGIQQKTALPAP